MMSWDQQTVLVTGAGGFIGSHLAERLVQLGARTRAFVRYRSDGSWGWLDSLGCRDELEVVVGDVTDRDAVMQAMEGVQVVFHLAALIAIPYSYQAPASFVQTNVVGTLNVLQAARACGIKRLVHTSTSEVYGTAQCVPIDESHPLLGQSPYAATKIGADKLTEAFHRSYGLPVTIVRPFNTYGPRQSGRAIVPTIVTQALAEQRIRLGNLHPTRDLNFVSDTVEGFLQAAAAPDAVGRTFNLGCGREITIGDLAQLIGRLVNRSVTVEQEDERVRPPGSEVERLMADSTAARQVLGWSPQVTLEQVLEHTIAWIREHLNAYRQGAYVV